MRAGDTTHVSRAVFYCTRNTGWEPLRLLALYNLGGAEKVLRALPDYQKLPAGQNPNLTRS